MSLTPSRIVSRPRDGAARAPATPHGVHYLMQHGHLVIFLGNLIVIASIVCCPIYANERAEGGCVAAAGLAAEV